MLKIDAKTFETEVAGCETPVLVDFYADWCGPCKKMEPFIEKVSNDFTGKVKFVKMNCDENQQFASSFHVKSLPTLIMFKAGKEVERRLGQQSEQDLHKLVNGVLAQQ
jgi:thioredoxin 1